MTTEPADTLALASQPAESLRTLNAELLGALQTDIAQLHRAKFTSAINEPLLQVTTDGRISKIKQSLQP